MKRTLSAILVVVLCLALCACGASAPSEADLKVQTEKETFEAAVSLLEAGEYDEAIEAFSSIESYRVVADKIDEAINLKADAEKAAKEAEEAARSRTEIEITVDNWADYFEFVQMPAFDAFGDLDRINHILVPKQEFADRIAFQDVFSIDFAYKGIGTTASVKIDDSGAFIYGGPLPGWGGHLYRDEILSLSNTTLESIINYVYHEGEATTAGVVASDKIYHENGMNGCNEWVFTIEKVQGTIILYTE